MKSLSPRLKSVMITAMMLVFATVSFAQNRISGKVVDESGLAVIGAGVVQKGTTNGVVTDPDGNFTINVNEGSILEVSCLNYHTKEQAAANGMTVVLSESTEALDEIVVVGYGVQKKSDLTGAISSVKENDLNARSVTSPEMVLRERQQVYRFSATLQNLVQLLQYASVVSAQMALQTLSMSLTAVLPTASAI